MPSQSKLLHQSPDASGRGAETEAVRQVHQLSPVKMSILKQGGLLAPLGMLVPEPFANVR